MADPVTSLDRIESALARIEAAAAAREQQLIEVTRRHRTLRDRVESAVASLDALHAPKEG